MRGRPTRHSVNLNGIGAARLGPKGARSKRTGAQERGEKKRKKERTERNGKKRHHQPTSILRVVVHFRERRRESVVGAVRRRRRRRAKERRTDGRTTGQKARSYPCLFLRTLVVVVETASQPAGRQQQTKKEVVNIIVCRSVGRSVS